LRRGLDRVPQADASSGVAGQTCTAGSPWFSDGFESRLDAQSENDAQSRDGEDKKGR